MRAAGPPAGAPLLELRGVSKRFGAVVIADDIHLTVRPGEALGVIGPNGAGKTTLLGLVGGDRRPDAGEVLLDGQPVTSLPAARRAVLGIGRTYQVPRPFAALTVFENALVAAQAGAKQRGQAAYACAYAGLEVAGLLDRANTLAGDLGLLARKRLELARALAVRPTLLLLDEIAGGLTEPEVDALVVTVRGVLQRGVAVVWIEHVVRALQGTVTRLVCLHGGRWIAQGTCEEVLADAAVREVYLGSPALTASPVTPHATPAQALAPAL